MDLGLVQVLLELYGNDSSALLLNAQIGHFVRTSLDNMFLAKIMQETFKTTTTPSPSLADLSLM
ncbi:hypothetical protein DPMN_132579 [Dreissena polymorpha]|uniref:Uncharacterized protein n=1 Tax=Dreissena polymorpha TaxID=45954 RepID=A0A9D4FSS0_DREPO|nr:hypothetical protein DPMN_132579 [Dreissena polymorpha]